MKLKFTTREALLDSFIRTELLKLNGAVIAKTPMDFFTIRAAILPRWQFESDTKTMDMVLDPDQFRVAWNRVLRPGGGWSKSLGPPRSGGGPAGQPVKLTPKPTNDRGAGQRPMQQMPVPKPKPDDQPAGGGMEL